MLLTRGFGGPLQILPVGVLVKLLVCSAKSESEDEKHSESVPR